jgi:hypothetical protein
MSWENMAPLSTAPWHGQIMERRTCKINEGKHVSTIHSSMAWTNNGKKNGQNK